MGLLAARNCLQPVERWVQWTGIRAKPAKCHSLGIRTSTGKSFDPALTIDGQPIIPFIRNEAIKFLGRVIQVPPDTHSIKSQVLSKLTRMLERVDGTPVTRQQKLKLYRVGICPRMSWDLAVNNPPLLRVTGTPEATVTRFLKRWSGLAKTTDTVRLYLPQFKEALTSLLSSCCIRSSKSHRLASWWPLRTRLHVRFTTTVEIKREEVLQRATH